MSNQKSYNEYIKKNIIKLLKSYNITLKEIILFGSRARGDNEQISDFDILIIVDNNLALKEKMILQKEIRVSLARFYIKNKITAGTDVIVKSKSEIDLFKNRHGSIVNSAMSEGILL